MLNADGVSQSVVRLVLRDDKGRPISGRSVLFQHNGDGLMVPSAASTFVGPVQTGLVMATDKNGVANVVYVAGSGIGTVDGVRAALRHRHHVHLGAVRRDPPAVIP